MKRRLTAFFLLSLMLLFPVSCKGTLEHLPQTEETTKTEAERATETPDPKEDGVMNVLMIGNSACYYYVTELYGVARAAGIPMKVCNLYDSGCTLEMHWDRWKKSEAPYTFFVTDENGRRQYDKVSLEQCLSKENWDVISLQEHISPARSLDREMAFQKTEPYMRDLIAYLKEHFPKSDFYFHQTWASEIGYDRPNGKVLDKEAQLLQYQVIRDVSIALSKRYDLTRIPVGDAWQIARENSVIGDTLCHKNGQVGDYGHDGDTGGGRYLNACVWFEVLTGEGCIGNTFRPEYELSEEKIAALQMAAHQAVETAKEESK